MSKAIFITGVSTEVGKTYFSFLLLKKLKSIGKKTLYFKPIETGGDEPQDYLLCSKIATVAPPPIYHFKTPVSPHLAAKIENKKKIDIKKIKVKIKEIQKSDVDFAIVEGAGGLMVPITDYYTYADLIEEIKTPIIIVASSYLGVINHTLLTIEAARTRKIKIIGVVLNFTKEPENIAEKTNENVLKNLIGEIFLGKINYRETELPEDILRKIEVKP